MDRINCICCNREIEAEMAENPMVISPVYDGLIFRATGNFGSTIFDPIATDGEELLQVIICDNCIKRKIKRVTRIFDINNIVTAKVELFKFEEEHGG